MRRKKNSDPLRQIGCRFQKLLLFPEEFDPFRQLQLAGGGGSRGGKKLDSRVLLALRQFPRLARMGHTPFLTKWLTETNSEYNRK